MAIQKVIRALILGASPSKKNKEIMRLPLGAGQFLDISKPIHDGVVSGEYETVSYDDDVTPLEVTNDDGTKVELKFYRVCDIDESMEVALSRKMRKIEAIEAFDQARYDAAMKKAEGLVI